MVQRNHDVPTGSGGDRATLQMGMGSRLPIIDIEPVLHAGHRFGLSSRSGRFSDWGARSSGDSVGSVKKFLHSSRESVLLRGERKP